MKREDIELARSLVSEIDYLEKVLEYMDKNKHFESHGSMFTVQFTNQLSYNFRPNVQHSMFNNILRSSIEDDLDKAKYKLEQL
jgi:hypothetical protein